MKILTNIQAKFNFKGYTAVIRFEKTNKNHIFVEWRKDGETIDYWNAHLEVFYIRLRNKIVPTRYPEKTLWSY